MLKKRKFSIRMSIRVMKFNVLMLFMDICICPNAKEGKKHKDKGLSF